MTRTRDGIVGGLVAGLATTLLMQLGRRSGAMSRTLDRDAVDWLDRNTGSREVIGDTGTSAVEFANHMAASALFGAGYAELERVTPDIDPALRGALLGAGLYAVNIAGIAPLIGLTEGEIDAGPRKAAERLGVHLVFGVVTALVAEQLRDGR